MSNIMKIEVNGTLYHIKRPCGRVGAKHFGIITKAIPSVAPGTAPEDTIMSERDQERMSEAFEAWAIQVLPNLLLPDLNKYENIPGEDQYGIFMAMLEDIKLCDDFFRVVE